MLFREEAHTVRNVAELLAATCSDETISRIVNSLITVDDDLDFSDHESAVAELLRDRLIALKPAAIVGLADAI